MLYNRSSSNHHRHHPANQAGLVLFFALLALAVMSIAAVSLIRSVDTNALLSGNMVFRQSASSASNVALEGVAENISKKVLLIDSVKHNAQLGYYANCSQFDAQPSALICDAKLLTTMAWNDANSSLVPSQTDGNDEIRNGIDRQGNEIRYVIERMCNYSDAEINAGTAKSEAARCMMASSPSNGENCSHNVTNIELFKQCIASSDSPLYRVTLRIAGPKNTLTFMQSFISN
ncbi:MAG: pilus assembly PilX family protein [Methylophilus sp.]|uniref:pilus assembly PilX family protein n=1 Tax=Methylophilus sp. TaxID=29541 RepID=UPI003FA01489